MRILAVDTATKSCSVAVVDDRTVLAEATVMTGETHSKHLMCLIHHIIRISHMALEDLDGFAVTRGPGSFTGLRIGISTVKGLAASSGKPMVGISSLDALANQTDTTSHLICAVIDARKAEVYFARYRRIDGVLVKDSEEKVLSIVEAVKGIDEPSYFIGDGALSHRSTALAAMGKTPVVFAPRFHHIIRASTVAYLGMERFRKNDDDDVSTFTPHYVRKSDAELNSSKKRV